MKLEEMIFDKNITLNDFASFQKCKILDEGKVIEFQMANGMSYKVQLSKIEKWFLIPSGYFDNSKAKLKKDCPGLHNKKIVRIRRILRRSAIRIYLSDHSFYDVAWDAVLMACEPHYEHYGGIKAKCP